MSGIFISYRRVDSAGSSGRLWDRLSQHFGRKRVFMDVEGGIERGANFPQVIQRALHTSNAMLVVIGNRWLDCVDRDGKPRLQNPDDWVRNETAFALRSNLLLLPVLVDRASMPAAEELPEDIRGLTDKHASEIRNSSWDYDVGEIIKTLERVVPPKFRVSRKVVVGLPSALALGAAAWLVVTLSPTTDDNVELTKSNIVEVLTQTGFTDIHVATEMNWVLDALKKNGIATKGQLRTLATDRFTIAKLKQLYVEELKRDVTSPLDAVAVTMYGSFLYKNGGSDQAVNAIRQAIRSSEEYKRVHATGGQQQR